MVMLWAHCTVQARAFDLDALMALMAQRGKREAHFTEQRFVQDLQQPLRSSGTLSFEPPDRLTRRTLEPRVDEMVGEGNRVTLTRGDRSRTLAIDSAPEVAGLIEALRATLGGNAALLRQYFQITLVGGAPNWSLELRPRDTRLAQQIQNVRIAGAEDDLLDVELDFRNGDRTVTTITPAQPRPSRP